MIDLVFEWDPEKERENFEKHGVDFKAAEKVFLTRSEWNVMTMIQAMRKIAGKQWVFLMKCFLWSIRTRRHYPHNVGSGCRAF
jgi:hypothetical protein